jgi:uncharacterized protein YukE
MSGFFQVDLDVLQQMTKTLQDAGDQMDAALKSMGSSQAGQLGTAELNRAADDFQSTWQYGLGQLRQAIQETNDGVKKAHDAYKQCDDSVGQAVGQINGQIMGQIDSMAATAMPKGAK